jgi:glycosyltransferase involved in cell wall biosynthesis
MYELLTIVIPCYNEEKYIGRALQNIYDQDYSRFIRIIVADAGSTDNTISIINSFKNKLDIEVVKGGLPSVGRNAGARLADTEWILFLDADITFTSESVIFDSIYQVMFNNYSMIGTTPKYFGEPDFKAEIMFFFNRITTWILSKTRPFAIGGFTLIRRDVFVGLGGYNEKAHQSEDWLLSRQIKPAKFKLIHNLITQDNRRFKKYGYLNMIKLLYRNWKNRNNIEYFYNAQNYWD